MSSQIRNIFLACTIGFCFCLFSHEKSLKETNREKFLPLPQQILHHYGHSLAYDGRCRQAHWVYQYLTKENIQGNVDRQKFEFHPDPYLPLCIQSNNEDYKGSGFDRGHLCPAADQRSHEKAMEATFFLSNISPQNPLFNRNYWAKFERYIRNLTNEYLALHVITGPLYLPYEESDGKKYVKYRVIGENQVAVPTHFYKIIFLEKEGSISSQAYIMPNENIPQSTPFEEFKCTIEKVEKVSGLIFPFKST